MKAKTNWIIQLSAIATQLVNQFGGLIPLKAQPYVMTGMTILQAITGLMAHVYNTDGTPQEVAKLPDTLTIPGTHS